MSDIIVPELGESISEAVIANWLKKPGDQVKKDEPIVELETDKVTLEVNAPDDGFLADIKANEDDTVSVGDIIGSISAQPVAGAQPSGDKSAQSSQTKNESVATIQQPSEAENSRAPSLDLPNPAVEAKNNIMSPAAAKIASEKGINANEISGTGKDGRITKADVLGVSTSTVQAGAVNVGAPTSMGGASNAASKPQESTQVQPQMQTTQPQARPQVQAQPQSQLQSHPQAKPAQKQTTSTNSGNDTDVLGLSSSFVREEKRVKMSRLRQKIAERLKFAQENAAMLTTFNEIDMSKAMQLRSEIKDEFQQKHGVKLGFMSFFVKACVNALRDVPAVNAEIDGKNKEIIYRSYADVGVAVGTEQGLIVPVVKNANAMSFAQIEKEIMNLATKARGGRLSIDELSGGTFTISNGGVYGSLLSTPILNPPQSGILGMHKIEKRPVVINDEVVVRPMMYVALSYDHRIIDGKEAVTFLVKVKENIENPERMLFDL